MIMDFITKSSKLLLEPKSRNSFKKIQRAEDEKSSKKPSISLKGHLSKMIKQSFTNFNIILQKLLFKHGNKCKKQMEAHSTSCFQNLKIYQVENKIFSVAINLTLFISTDAKMYAQFPISEE